MTAQELVTAALVRARIADPGEGPSTSEIDDAFVSLNDLLASWSAAGVGVPQIKRESFSLTGAASYTIGTGATFNTVRPLAIKAASVASGGATSNMEIVTANGWTELGDKSRAGKFARKLFYDAGYPSGTIHLWPAPVTGGSLELYSYKPLTAFSDLTDTVDLPPGYDRALKFALAFDLCTEYGRPVDAALQAAAAEAKQAVFELNAKVISGAAPAAPAAQ